MLISLIVFRSSAQSNFTQVSCPHTCQSPAAGKMLTAAVYCNQDARVAEKLPVIEREENGEKSQI